MSISLRILVLDDDELRHESFRKRFKDHIVVHVWNYKEAVAELKKEKFDIVHLDRDLEDFEKKDGGGYREWTGEDVADFIASMSAEQKPSRAIVHSWNVSGAARMGKTLYDAGIRTHIEPFRP